MGSPSSTGTTSVTVTVTALVDLHTKREQPRRSIGQVQSCRLGVSVIRVEAHRKGPGGTSPF